MSAARGESGQATVEFLAMVPLLVLVGLALLFALAGRGAREAADQAAVAGAVAQLQGKDPKAAAEAASPSWSASSVKVADGRVTVRITPRVPAFARSALAADRTVVFAAGGS